MGWLEGLTALGVLAGMAYILLAKMAGNDSKMYNKLRGFFAGGVYKQDKVKVPDQIFSTIQEEERTMM